MDFGKDAKKLSQSTVPECRVFLVTERKREGLKSHWTCDNHFGTGYDNHKQNIIITKLNTGKKRTIKPNKTRLAGTFSTPG